MNELSSILTTNLMTFPMVHLIALFDIDTG